MDREHRQLMSVHKRTGKEPQRLLVDLVQPASVVVVHPLAKPGTHLLGGVRGGISISSGKCPLLNLEVPSKSHRDFWNFHIMEYRFWKSNFLCIIAANILEVTRVHRPIIKITKIPFRSDPRNSIKLEPLLIWVVAGVS